MGNYHKDSGEIVKKAIFILMIALNNNVLHALPALGQAHNRAAAKSKSRHLPPARPVDFSQAERMLELLSAHATGPTTVQQVDAVLHARGTDLIIRQQNISRHVTREQYESVLRALANEQPPKIEPAAMGERSRRGVEGLLSNVWPSLRWGIQNTRLLTERLNSLRRTIDQGRALRLANSFFPDRLKVMPRLYVVMGGRAGAAALDGDEIYFDLLATSYYAETGTLAKFPTSQQVLEFFAHEIHHLLMAKHIERLNAQLSLTEPEKSALSFLAALVLEGSATYLINEHRRAEELRADPQFESYLQRINDLGRVCEEIPRRILDEALAAEAYEQAIAALTGSGWHVAGGLMISVIDRVEGLEGVFKVLRDPRKLYLAYNRSASNLPKNSLPFAPFQDALSRRLSEMGARGAKRLPKTQN